MKNPTARIARLKKSIALQERTLALLVGSTVEDNGATVALTNQILSNLRASLALAEARS